MAQAPARADKAAAPELSFAGYMAQVARANLALLAQRAGLPVAEAQVAVAGIFPDPVISFGVASLDVSRVGAQNNLAAGLSVPVEWPGKRRGRLAVARASRDLAAAEIAESARALRAAAATAYVDALFAERVQQRRRQAHQSLAQLVAANEERQRQGAVAEIVVVQARIEARRASAEAITAEGEARAARIALAVQMGSPELRPEQIPHAVDSAVFQGARRFTEEDLVATALRARPDVRARREALRVADARVDLASANRGLDFSLSLGWLYYTPGAAESAFSAPPYHTVSAMLSVPLPLFSFLGREVRAGLRGRAQAAAQQRSLELQVTAEVRAAFERYEAARRRLAEYDRSLLADNDRLLEMALYAFAQGSSRLIELLSAQRTWTDTYLAYETAVADQARALITLETAAGAWDLGWTGG